MPATNSASTQVILPASLAGLSETGLLAGLAQEAKEKLGSMQSMLQENQAKARRVDDALNRIIKFFNSFIRHVNAVEPSINRTYRYDARTIYCNLKWRGATIDYRKQSISDEALMEYVTFSVNLYAPEPVQLKRPWVPIETLKKELQHLRLRLMDDMETGQQEDQAGMVECAVGP